ncbi:hypothetical protein [Metaplanococcus flavidus]|uniref:Uncharacterized protein n=1 Tax=Metaplanococcus flavidus TaxID=569883 RepID=A0ABW3L9J2_9BACL
MLFEILLSAFLLFVGISGIISAYKMDKKSQEKARKDPYSAIFTLLPLELAKFLLFFLSLAPIAIVTGMWLQKYGVIE